MMLTTETLSKDQKHSFRPLQHHQIFMYDKQQARLMNEEIFNHLHLHMVVSSAAAHLLPTPAAFEHFSFDQIQYAEY